MSNPREIWTQNLFLFLVLAILAYFAFRPSIPLAMAAGGGWETDGIMAVSLEPQERMVLIDTAKKNICIYKISGQSTYRLIGARSYKYDMEISDSANTAIEDSSNGMTYVEVRNLYEAIQARKTKGP